MFKIVAEEASVLLEMTLEYFNLAIRIGDYIDNNFEASDIFTISYVWHEPLSKLVNKLKQIDLEQNPAVVSFRLDKAEYSIFGSMFANASNFLVELEGFEGFEDQINGALEVMERRSTLH